MSNNLLKIIIAISVASSMVTPTLADGIGDVFKNQNQARAGVYFRLPFAGGLKKTDKHELSYGFAMGFARDFRSQAGSSMMDARRSFNADIIKLNFNADGFNSFNVGGQDIYSINRTRLGAAEGEISPLNYLLRFVGVGLAIVGVVTLTSKNDVTNQGLINDDCIPLGAC